MTTTAVEPAPPRPPPHRRRGMRWAVGILGTILVLAGVGFWRAHSVANATIARHLASYETALAQIRATPVSRPALLQPEEVGDARELVEAFHLALEATDPSDLEALSDFPAGDAPRRGLGLQRNVHNHLRTSMETLDDAWHRRLGGSRADFEGVTHHQSIELLAKEKKALQAAIRLARDIGDAGQAVRLAANQALLAQDSARCGNLFATFRGTGTEAEAMLELLNILQVHPIAKFELARLAAQVSALRASRPSAGSVLRMSMTMFECVMADEAVFASEILPQADPSDIRTWRSLYSTRISRSNALRAFESFEEKMPVALAAKTWQDAELRRAEAHVLAIADPLLAGCLSAWWTFPGWLRTRDTRAAVLELGIAIARFEAEYGRWPTAESDLVPAYLTAIPTSPYDPSGLRFAGNQAWSRGPDSDDDGGTPMPDPKVMDGDGDVVVEVKGRQ